MIDRDKLAKLRAERAALDTAIKNVTDKRCNHAIATVVDAFRADPKTFVAHVPAMVNVLIELARSFK